MPKRGYKKNSDTSETQSLDPTFGQTKAFAVADPLVNPDAIAYLNSVREEALRTTALSTERSSQTNEKRVDKGALYDEEPVLSPEFLRFTKLQDTWHDWFLKLKSNIGTEGYRSSGYDEKSLDLLVAYFKKYIETKDKEEDPTIAALLSALRDVPHPEDDDESLTIDEEWAEKLLHRLQAKKAQLPKDSTDLKKLMTEPDELPRNFNAWYYYITNNDPSFLTLERMSPGQVVKLASYMAQWIAEVTKNKNEKRITQWLLFILLYLPDRLPAQEISMVRLLGKKARAMKLKSVKEKEPLHDLELIPVIFNGEKPGSFSVVDLTLVVVGLTYGQRDLLSWESE